MMKKAASLLVIATLLLSLGTNFARASEVTGTISTDGGSTGTTGGSSNQNNNGGNNGGNNNTGGTNNTGGNTSTTTDTGGHSSEVTGDLGSNTGSNSGSTQNQNTDTSNTNTNTGSNSTGGYVINGPVENHHTGNPDDNKSLLFATTSEPTPTSITTSGGLTDEERAHLALMDFGPRYGTPGAPLAGGTGNDLSKLSVASDNALEQLGNSPEKPQVAFVPRSGEGPISATQQTADAITNASGLSMPQLILIAIFGLILLGSMGYAVSRSGRRAV